MFYYISQYFKRELLFFMMVRVPKYFIFFVFGSFYLGVHVALKIMWWAQKVMIPAGRNSSKNALLQHFVFTMFSTSEPEINASNTNYWHSTVTSFYRLYSSRAWGEWVKIKKKVWKLWECSVWPYIWYWLIVSEQHVLHTVTSSWDSLSNTNIFRLSSSMDRPSTKPLEDINKDMSFFNRTLFLGPTGFHFKALFGTNSTKWNFNMKQTHVFSV